MKKLVFGLISFAIASPLFGDSITPGVGLLKPTTGYVDSTRSWADKLNSNFDIIAATLSNQSAQFSNITASTGQIIVNGVRVSTVIFQGSGQSVSINGGTATVTISGGGSGGGGGMSVQYNGGAIASVSTFNFTGDAIASIQNGSTTVRVDLSTLTARLNNLDTSTAALSARDVSGSTTSRLNNIDFSTSILRSNLNNVVSTNIVNGTIVAADVATSVFLSSDTSGVTEGSYTNSNLTVDRNGRITAAANGTGGSGGDVSGTTTTRLNNLDASTATLTTRINNHDSSTATLTTRIGNLDSSTATLTIRISNLDTSTAAISARDVSGTTTTRLNNLDSSTATLTTRLNNLDTSTAAISARDVSGTTTTRLNNLDTSTAALLSRINTVDSTGHIFSTNVAVSVFLSSNAIGVTEGSYTNTNLTVDRNGRITAASNGSAGAGGASDGWGNRTATGDVLMNGWGFSGTVSTITISSAVYSRGQWVETPIDAGAIQGSSSSGAGDGAGFSQKREVGISNKVNITYLAFSSTTDQTGFFKFKFPYGWDGGTISYRYAVTYDSAPIHIVSPAVVFGLKALAVSSGASLNAAYGSEVTAPTVVTSSDIVQMSTISPAITIASSLKGSEVNFAITRKASDAADNAGAPAQLLELYLIWKRNDFEDFRP